MSGLVRRGRAAGRGSAANKSDDGAKSPTPKTAAAGAIGQGRDESTTPAHGYGLQPNCPVVCFLVSGLLVSPARFAIDLPTSKFLLVRSLRRCQVGARGVRSGLAWSSVSWRPSGAWSVRVPVAVEAAAAALPAASSQVLQVLLPMPTPKDDQTGSDDACQRWTQLQIGGLRHHHQGRSDQQRPPWNPSRQPHDQQHRRPVHTDLTRSRMPRLDARGRWLADAEQRN